MNIHTHISNNKHTHTCIEAHTSEALPLSGAFSYNSKWEKCKADTRSVLNGGWKSCVVKKTDEVEMWTQALCLFLSAINRLKEGMDSQHLCLPSPPPVPVLSVFLESAFANVSLSPLHLCPLLKADRGTYAQKADNSPLGTGGTGKQTALLCVSPLEFTATASLLKRSTFIMRWRLESALYLILTRPPFSPRVVHHIHWSLADWQEYQHDSRDSNSQLSTTLTFGRGGACILSFCYYLELCVYGAHSLQSHLKHQRHSKACKQSSGCKSCLMMITQGLGLLLTHSKCRIGQERTGQSASVEVEVLQCSLKPHQLAIIPAVRLKN